MCKKFPVGRLQDCIIAVLLSLESQLSMISDGG